MPLNRLLVDFNHQQVIAFLMVLGNERSKFEPSYMKRMVGPADAFRGHNKGFEGICGEACGVPLS